MGLLAADLLRMRKRWMVRIVLLILLLIIGLVLVGIGHNSAEASNVDYPFGILAALVISASLSSFLWPVIAGNWAGNEYGWGTIRLTLARKPNRIEMVLSALISIMLTVAVGLLLVVVLSTVIGVILNAITPVTRPIPSDLGIVAVKTFLADCYNGLFFVLLAYAAGTIFQSAAAGIGFGIGFGVAQTVLTGIFTALGGIWHTVADHLPEAYLTALPDRLTAPDLSTTFRAANPSEPSIMASIVGIGIYCAVLLAVTLAVVWRRDVTA